VKKGITLFSLNTSKKMPVFLDNTKTGPFLDFWSLKMKRRISHIFPAIKITKTSFDFIAFQFFYAGGKCSKTPNNASYFLQLSPNILCLNTNIVLKFGVGLIEIRLENAGAHNYPYASMRSTFKFPSSDSKIIH
jgi:hypothetical protein